MGKRIECLIEAGKNAPRALFELALFSSIPVGGLVAGIGGGISYLAGNYELASKIGALGVLTGGLGLIAVPAYLFAINEPHTELGIYEPNVAIENFLNAIREYKKISKEKEE